MLIFKSIPMIFTIMLASKYRRKKAFTRTDHIYLQYTWKDHYMFFQFNRSGQHEFLSFHSQLHINILATWHALLKRKNWKKERRGTRLQVKKFPSYIFSFNIPNKISERKRQWKSGGTHLIHILLTQFFI